MHLHTSSAASAERITASLPSEALQEQSMVTHFYTTVVLIQLIVKDIIKANPRLPTHAAKPPAEHLCAHHSRNILYVSWVQDPPPLLRNILRTG